MSYLRYVGLGELLQHVLRDERDEPSVGYLHGREPPVLAELRDCDVRCS